MADRFLDTPTDTALPPPPLLGSAVGDSAPQIDQRPDARIVRSALDEVRAIQTLLSDVYKDQGDGRTLLRELVQNADDSKAERLVFCVMDRGWPDAENTLLRGPALLVANDGPFPAKDRDALHRAIGGSKSDEIGKIGRFGVGLKSAFHICEALVYLGAEEGVLRPGALNPWAGTGDSGDTDPLHPDWDMIGEADLKRLRQVTDHLLGAFDAGLLLWFPLRRSEHLDRARDRPYGLGEARPAVDEIAAWFNRPASLALLLAQCGHLHSIDADRVDEPSKLDKRTILARVARPGFHSAEWVGRHADDELSMPNRPFDGRIDGTTCGWSILGVDALGLDSLRSLRTAAHWPRDPHWKEGRSFFSARKALAHAAVTVMRPDAAVSERVGARLRWAVFLPLDDDPNPRSTAVVETVGDASSSAAWDIIMHGYFWPTHDRRSIPGVTDDDSATGETAIRAQWNRALRDELLLPLLPSALATAAFDISEQVARELLRLIRDSRIVQTNIAAVTRCHALLPQLTLGGVRWTSLDTAGTIIVSIPGWTRAPSAVRNSFAKHLNDPTESVIFVDDDAPRIGGTVVEWPLDWLARLLACISADALRSAEQLAWIDELARHVIALPTPGHQERASLFASWLARRIGEGALSSASDNSSREKLRAAWRSIISALPVEWIVEAPIESQQAVAELGRIGIIGEYLLPIPFGRRPEGNRSTKPNPGRLDRALLELGNLLLAGQQGTSQSLQRARLLLAESLLSVREGKPLGRDLAALPLLRAHKLPEEKDEPWSVGQLRSYTERRRVFARPGLDDGSDAAALEAPSDPKRAAKDLAEAIGENVWIVDDMVASTAGVPVPTTAALAAAIFQTDSIKSPVLQRIGLLRRLGQDGENADIRAIRTLLTGRRCEPGEEIELYYVRSQDSNGEANRKTLDSLLLLLGTEWRAVEAKLIEPLPFALVGNLHVTAVDSGVLYRLLGDCLEGSADWSQLDRPTILHLLEQLHDTGTEDRLRWRLMPLHRGADGERGSFDERALRIVGEMRLPSELETEIRLLQPDVEIKHLYADVAGLDDDGVLRAMLLSQHPQWFADQIVRTLRTKSNRVTLPRDPKMIELLQTSSWLPHRDGVSGVAPRHLLIVPRELQSAVAPLARAGAIGEHWLSEDIASPIGDAADGVVHEIFNRPGRARQLLNLASALEPAKVAKLADGAYLVLRDGQRVTPSLIEDALQSPLASSHPGWAIIRTAATLLPPNAERQHHDAVLAIARKLCAPIPAACQVSMLTTVSTTHPAKDSASGRLFRSLLASFAESDVFFHDVLAHLLLPTQDAQWHSASVVARSASGVARGHRIVSDLRPILRLDSDTPVPETTTTEFMTDKGPVDALEAYFEAWADRVPRGAVGSFLGILANGKDDGILNLAEKWLGADVNVEGMRRDLVQSAGQDPWSRVKIFVSRRVAHGQRVRAINLLGAQVEMDAGSDSDTIFAADPIPRLSQLGDFWELGFRDVDPAQRTSHELIALLGGTVEWWAVRVLRLDLHKVQTWWSRWGTGSQAQVGPVQASILAHLPLTLHQLDIRECEALKQALAEAQRAQRRREQAPVAATIQAERIALDTLGQMIRDDPDHQRFLWSRVQDLMRRFGYRDDSALLELAQNADDAVSQASEIAGAPMPLAARRLVVRVHCESGQTTIDVTHYGRPINETGGATFPAGRDRQWDQDLYFMMLLNLSGKPGETPGQTALGATTGRFGLGFKSIHLVSDSPSVVSGFIAFSIAGGLLPFEQRVPLDPDLNPVDGRRATRIRVPLRKDKDAQDLLRSIFSRFVHARSLLPVFARQLREVVVEGCSFAGVSTFDPQPLGTAGWSLAANTVEVPGHGQWRMLRFRPADAGVDSGTGTAALAVGLKDGMPTPFPATLPFLWNVMPTSEGWGCGYAVNGPFKLDPGRSHVSLDDGATSHVVDLLGVALGDGLVTLNDFLLRGSKETLSGVPPIDDVPAFLADLWMVLASGMDTPDALRQQFLRRLHGPGRGLSLWMGARAVVPSELPPPFARHLPALEPGVRLEVISEVLANPDLCSAFSQIADLAALAVTHAVVSRRVATRLRPLVNQTISSLDLFDLLAELADTWGDVLTSERLHALRPLAIDAAWPAIWGKPWFTKFVAKAADGTFRPLRELLLPRRADAPQIDADMEDETRRAAFAPDRYALAEGYIVKPIDLELFRRLRGRLQIDSHTLAGWYETLSPDRRPAALAYLLRGKLQQEILQCLVRPEDRPGWLRDYNDVSKMLEGIEVDRWRSQQLLAALFPDQFRDDPISSGPSPLSEPGKRRFFDGLEAWWEDPSIRSAVIDTYEAKAWPAWLRREGIAEGLESGSQDHWLALLILGACRTIGRADAGHHRSFLESAQSEGWWDVFRTPDDIEAWMNVLRTWQDKAAASLTYPRWMSLFPAIYQFSRYLEKYSRLLKSAAQRPAELYQVTCLLTPRVDEALTGAGQHFDAPPAPLNMGLHWVLRELVRVGVLNGNHIFPDCWVPSDGILRFLQPLGLDPPDGGSTNSAKAHAIFDFLASELHTDTPHLHRAFDIPLHHINSSRDLRRRFGLED